MQTTEEWLNEKLVDYTAEPKETLEDMLSKTTDIMEQYDKNPESQVARGAFESCIYHNKLFLDCIEEINT